MVKKTLKERLINYLLKRPGEWVASGEIQRVVARYTSYTPGNVSRRLRELENDGKIQVELRKNHAWYRAAKPVDLRKQHDDMVKIWRETP